MLKHSNATVSGRSGGSRRGVAGGWAAVFLAAFLLYGLTAGRGIQWQDSGDRALRIYLQDVGNPLGLALAHPLHHWLGRLAVAIGGGGIEPVLAITLVSALAAAIAVANVFGCVVTASFCRNGPKGEGDRVGSPNKHKMNLTPFAAALFAAASLALANTFWQLATITEVYTVSAALLAGECWCLIAFAQGAGRWAFWGMLLLNGLGVANHLQAGLMTPVLLAVTVFAWRGRRIGMRDVLIGAGLWLAGTLPYSALVVAAWISSGDFGGTLRSALVGKYGANVLNTRMSARVLLVSVAFPLFNFPNLLLPAAAYGMARARRMGVPALARRALAAGLVLHALFVFRYNIEDQYMFFLPAYVLLCIFGGIGAAAVGRWSSAAWRRAAGAAAAVMLALTPLVYWGTAAALRRCGALARFVHEPHKPYRDNYQYLFVPWSVAETSADRMSREAVQLAGAGGLIIVQDPMAQFAVEYRALRSGLPGVEIRLWPGGAARKDERAELLERVREKAAGGWHVVLVPADRDRPAADAPVGRWERKGDLYVLDPGGVPASMGSTP